MDQGALTLRPATPNEFEGTLFAGYLESAAGGLFRLLLGPRYDSIISRAFTQPGHDMSYEYVTVAERAGEIVGMVSAYSSRQHSAASMSPLLRAARWRAIRMFALMPFAYRMVRFVDRVPDGDYYVQAVAVDDHARGAGIGSMLLDHAGRLAEQAGCRRLVLDVAEDNVAARGLYERRGMVAVAQSPKIAFVPESSVFRMVKDLNAES